MTSNPEPQKYSVIGGEPTERLITSALGGAKASYLQTPAASSMWAHRSHRYDFLWNVVWYRDEDSVTEGMVLLSVIEIVIALLSKFKK